MNAAAIVHETPGRLRLRLAPDSDPTDVRVCFEQLAGVKWVRVSPAARSLTLGYDGRSVTRRAILELLPTLQPASGRARSARVELPARNAETLPLEASLLTAALTPLLPAGARPVAALALVAAKTAAAWRRGEEPMATALDALALASTALTGHPLTATTSVLLGAVAERRRNGLLDETDRLLAELAEVDTARHRVQRADGVHTLAAADLAVGDRLRLSAGDLVPADARVLGGGAEVSAEPLAGVPTRRIARGARVASGARVLSGAVELCVERPAARSRAARLREHVRHALRTRDAPGPLTPDLERLVAVPITAAGLVLALTGDTARTASMLQADPQQGITLAQPVAREAALYATARHGLLLTGLDGLERLATATAVAFEDIGVLTEPYWHVEGVVEVGAAAQQARRWLARLVQPAGGGEDLAEEIGLPDEQVAALREFGAVLRDGARTLHIAGARLLERTWNVRLQEPDRRSLVRRLGIVEDGRLLAVIHLGCRVRPGVAQRFAQLRALGVRRIAIFTEDPAAQPARALLGLGADDVVSRDRQAQERWLDEAVQLGERVALVHTGLRDLLPPGGLSLCPVDAEAGAHGVLLGEPLASLLTARRAARDLRAALRARFGVSVALNSALMVAAAMRWLPPIATAAVKHGFSLLLLQQSARLARLDARQPIDAPGETSAAARGDAPGAAAATRVSL
jgi:cation-transporting P-type ATPase C